MSINTKEVAFGTKQEAVITPKPGHEVVGVKVINTADNQIVPAEVEKISDNPPQWRCSFLQPAGHVSIKPIVKPILYSVTIEENELCNIVLVEEDSAVDVEIKNAVNEGAENIKSSDFNNPQHSFNDGARASLDVGENNTLNESDVPSGFSVVEDDVVTMPTSSEPIEEDNSQPEADTFESLTKLLSKDDEKDDATKAQEPESKDDSVADGNEDDTPDSGENSAGDDEPEKNDEGSGDERVIPDDNFEEDFDDDEPRTMTQAEFDKKCDLFWSWKDKYDKGECPEEKWKEIQTKHRQLYKDIDEGKIMILEQ